MLPFLQLLVSFLIIYFDVVTHLCATQSIFHKYKHFNLRKGQNALYPFGWKMWYPKAAVFVCVTANTRMFSGNQHLAILRNSPFTYLGYIGKQYSHGNFIVSKYV